MIVTSTEFEKELENIGINKKEFSSLTKLPYQTIMNWRNKNTPVWVKSWLENYIEKRRFETVKQTLRDSGVCEE